MGFLIADATWQAAEANPDVYFLGVDQFVADGPENYVGIQFREDQSGFMTGVLAAYTAEWLESDTIAGVFLLDAAMNGVGLAPPNQSDLNMSVWEKTAEVSAMLIAGEIETGVNLLTGDLLADDDMMAEEDVESED